MKASTLTFVTVFSGIATACSTAPKPGIDIACNPAGTDTPSNTTFKEKITDYSGAQENISGSKNGGGFVTVTQGPLRPTREEARIIGELNFAVCKALKDGVLNQQNLNIRVAPPQP